VSPGGVSTTPRARTLSELAATRRPGQAPQAGYGSVLALTAILAIAILLTLMALALLLVHPNTTRLRALIAMGVNQQDQGVKTDLYIAAFFVVLPLALLAASRFGDRLAARSNGAALPALVSALVAGLAAALIVVRLSGALPWGDGVRGVLSAMIAWWLLAAAALARAWRDRPWPLLLRLQRSTPAPQWVAGLLVFGVLLCLTSGRSLAAVPLALGAVLAGGVLIASERMRPRRPPRVARAFDVVLAIVVLLAIPDTVIFNTSASLPNVYFDPGVVQFQHDWILGSTNQLLGGGALLVTVPVSQYGVGLIYFLDGWFHLVPIGYGTFGFLDGVLTALFYVAAYAGMRLAGARRLLAGGALVLGVLTLVYNFQFFVGQLPEEGPLRFGLPMLVLLGAIAAARYPGRARLARLASLAALGVSAIWALEAVAYTAFTFAAIAAVEVWLAPAGQRRRTLLTSFGSAVAACLVAHVLLALATLAGTGQLPHWHQYLGYVHEFLFGEAGSITYGFANWSPALAVYAGALISAAAIVLLIWRRPELARRNPVLVVALAGSTAYAIALLSYTDNRSSTYLFLYVAVPLLMAGVLWLSLARDHAPSISPALRRSVLASALAIAVLLFAGAWPAIGRHFSRSVLARAYSGGGLGARLTRLWHPPPIDRRALAGIELLDRYMPARHALVLLPTLSDLGLEILMRSGRANALPIGDPKADSLVPSVWLPTMRAAVPGLRAGQRVLLDREALHIIAVLRNPAVDPVTSRIDGGQPELEWILHQLDQRLRIHPIHSDPTGLIVAQLEPRGS
jgi:hypothetical protein